MAVKRFWCGASLANIDYIQCLMSLSSTNTDKAARAKSHQIFKITADFVKISETGQGTGRQSIIERHSLTRILYLAQTHS